MIQRFDSYRNLEPACEELWVTGMRFCCGRSVAPQEGTLDGCWERSGFHLWISKLAEAFGRELR